MNEENVVYAYSEILFTHKKKKEILLFATTWANAENTILSEISQTEEKNTICCHSYVESKRVKLVETESGKVVARG